MCCDTLTGWYRGLLRTDMGGFRNVSFRNQSLSVGILDCSSACFTVLLTTSRRMRLSAPVALVAPTVPVVLLVSPVVSQNPVVCPESSHDKPAGLLAVVNLRSSGVQWSLHGQGIFLP